MENSENIKTDQKSPTGGFRGLQNPPPAGGDGGVNFDAAVHVTGKSIYVDDIPVMEGMLFLKIFDSPVAHGKIKSIDFSEAEQTEGVVKIFSYKDIPGENQVGGIIPDEQLLADGEVHFCGQPILIIAAENEDAAEEALLHDCHSGTPSGRPRGDRSGAAQRPRPTRGRGRSGHRGRR